MDTIELDCGGLVFTASAAGPEGRGAVLMLHGFPQTRHTWRDQVPTLAEAGLRAVAPDQRGYSPGARRPAVADYHTDLLVADVLGIAAAVSTGPVHLVGHDWGGQLAWLTAARHPAAVRTLTVLSRPHPAAFARSFELDAGQAGRSRHHRSFDDPATADRLLEDGARRLRTLLADSGVPDSDATAYLSVLGERDALNAALNWYRAASDAGLRAADTPAVTVPTLYLWGTDDLSVGRTAAELTAEHVTGPYRFVELPGAGHFLTDDGHGDRVTDELLAHVGP